MGELQNFLQIRLAEFLLCLMEVRTITMALTLLKDIIMLHYEVQIQTEYYYFYQPLATMWQAMY